MIKLKSPFPYFGNKKGVAPEIWRRFGHVDRYLEPFAGALGCLLARPWDGEEKFTETVNDLNGHIVNVWRAIKYDPDAVLKYSDNQVSELDLHAFWHEAQRQRERVVSLMRTDPYAYDAEQAGMWVFGASAAIGSGWHVKIGSRPNIDNATGSPSQGRGSRNFDESLLTRLSARLRHVTVLCGDWRRCVSACPRGQYGGSKNKIVGVLLDPPYDNKKRKKGLYKIDDGSVAADAREWALEMGEDSRFRIALAGMYGEHEMPGWSTYQHSGNKGNSGKKSGGECVWFSPHCEGAA